LNKFLLKLSEELKKVAPGKMLHQGIADNYHKRLAQTLAQHGIKIEAESTQKAENSQGQSLVASVSAQDFLKNPLLAEEVFGPFSLIVRCKDFSSLNAVISHIHGQLTTSIIGREEEIASHRNLVNTIIEKAGRLIINGVPTGVEVCASMQHGGPYPATTDSRFTAVGTDAIKRFVRPVAFQNFIDSLLPDELKESNPLKIWRYRDTVWGKK
jgi:NADP-dependent aldehyde dehydrogenase